MKKINRLLKNKDFKNVLGNKKSVANKNYIIYIKKNDLNHIRVGISVSSKIGNSVIRHKIKRQINEMLKEIVDIKDNNDVVIIVKNKYLDNDFVSNKDSLKKCFLRLREGKENEKN